MVYKQLNGKVPVPEVLGWTEDGDQVFIYMSLIGRETLEQIWGALNDEEREAVCKELNGMVKSWRSLEQPNQVLYVGGLNNQPLNEIFLFGHRDLAAHSTVQTPSKNSRMAAISRLMGRCLWSSRMTTLCPQISFYRPGRIQ
ncbi:hypothetical protein DTO013E5_781 [Penicillium roqueforti]|nr:hypothetical protein DTO012A1_136 [Penicillium roqueforti]KAI3097558.1 hypothetical protein CBS147338_4650 [Penicillium roqueforti]KAI3170319.1 hypothetical protein DTO039G3_4548 [Penicillium roqueforti]KAI3190172.1 hypothetical protein DTO032C6_1845 [Penicillium roqueforti]KAI3217541.1 hypothetical protein DTO013E5_781 [Penicillium roqueforti]